MNLFGCLVRRHNNKRSWKIVNIQKHQLHVSTESIDDLDKIENERAVHIHDLIKRERVYGICIECSEPGTGEKWCQPCNSKRFEEDFKNWTSGNKEIDELIQHSQLNAVHNVKLLVWIPYEKFEGVTYVTRGGYGKIYYAKYREGFIICWDTKTQKWKRSFPELVALKSLDDTIDISEAFIPEIKSHLQVYIENIVPCYGITQDPETKEYMMVLHYCKNGNLRDFLNGPKDMMYYASKIIHLVKIIDGLRDIHNANKVHKDFHSGNILFGTKCPYIGDLGMCQSVYTENQSAKEGIFGVLPYMAPEVLRGSKYTKAADIYSFGIIMNEMISEEIPYNDTPHDSLLAVKICKGLRPEISKDTPKFLADLITTCWDANPENRPTAIKLSHLLNELKDGMKDKSTDVYSQMRTYIKTREATFKKRRHGTKGVKAHSQAIYTSRHLNFESLPKPENSSDLLAVRSVKLDNQIVRSVKSDNPISECFDCQLDDLDLTEE